MAESELDMSTAIDKHMDQLDVLSTTFVVPTLIVLLAGADIPKEFDLFGIHLKTEDAYGMVVAIFDCLLLLFSTTCWKVGDFLKLCQGSGKNRTLAAIFTHKWLLNPFSYSGGDILSCANCAVGAALLTFSWWIGLCSLKLLSGVTRGLSCTEKVFYALYFVFGATALIGIIRTFRVMDRLAPNGENASPDGISVAGRYPRLNIALKCVFSMVAIGLGFWLFEAFAHVA